MENVCIFKLYLKLLSLNYKDITNYVLSIAGFFLRKFLVMSLYRLVIPPLLCIR